MKEFMKVFVAFFKIGLFTFGGGYAMLPMFRKELIEKEKYITEDELMDYYSIGQCTPGIIAVNVATFTGYKIKGLYVATAFNAKGKPVFKKVTNGKRILLATATNYSTTGQHITSDTQEKEYGVVYDYLHPVTMVKVKYYDKLLKITTEEIFHLFYIQ